MLGTAKDDNGIVAQVVHTQSVIDPLPSCPGALSMAAKFLVTEKGRSCCVVRGRERVRVVVRGRQIWADLNRKARENMEQTL
jgi:hypothetical protein